MSRHTHSIAEKRALTPFDLVMPRKGRGVRKQTRSNLGGCLKSALTGSAPLLIAGGICPGTPSDRGWCAVLCCVFGTQYSGTVAGLGRSKKRAVSGGMECSESDTDLAIWIRSGWENDRDERGQRGRTDFVRCEQDLPKDGNVNPSQGTATRVQTNKQTGKKNRLPSRSPWTLMIVPRQGWALKITYGWQFGLGKLNIDFAGFGRDGTAPSVVSYSKIAAVR